MTVLNIILGVLGAQEIIFIALIVLILFGGKKIPELMKGLGKGVREYNKAVNNIKDQFDDIKDDINSPNTKEKDSENKKADS
ncbi:twin-arginine translocase TatA/TatE family subunit [Odoribacter sp. OttesenSCG-928-L07]|nr:twin-arginine translocase TatA/TatE family subunit [Odoribacter sp. OttesenSCG-928-L07]